MNSEFNNWNIIIEDDKYEELKNEIFSLKEKCMNLCKENKELKKKLEESKYFLNTNLLYQGNKLDYLEKKPFYLNYKYRFNNIYVPNYYYVNNKPINIQEDLIALKEQYIPISKYL